jgi:nitrogen fixation protein NifU and related proteins
VAGLEDLYREIILDHYRNPRNLGELPAPPAVRAEGFNPLCGDEVVVTVTVDGDRLDEVRQAGQGCSISRSSASMMSVAVKGRSVADARAIVRKVKAMMSVHEAQLDGEDLGGDDDGDGSANPEELGDVAALQGVVKFPVRIKCATLCWNALLQALDEVGEPAPS